MHRSPRLGYALAAAAATMWAFNGSIARFLLDDGMSAPRLAQLRSLISFLLLAGALALLRRDLLRVRRRDVPQLAFLGIAGLAGVHATYFWAIDRLEIGVALVIQYLAPVLVLLWLRIVHGRHLPRTLWGAVVLSVAGCFLVVEAYNADALDAVGAMAAFLAAITFAIYLVSGERAGERHVAQTTLVWAFGFASLFWAVVLPVWSFPTGYVDDPRGALLGLGVATIGTLFPFICMVTALRHIPPTRAAIVATLEPVLAAVIAWAVHGEALAAAQIAGGLIVVAAVVWVQSHPPTAAEHTVAGHASKAVQTRSKLPAG